MIHIDFADFEEMVVFARKLLGQNGEKAEREPERKQAHPPVGPSEDRPGQAPRGAAVAVPAAPVSVPRPSAPQPSSTMVPTTPAPQAPVAPTVPASAAVPTSTREYSMDDLARAAIPLMDAGGQQALVGLLSQFGVSALPELPKEQYGAFATALRGMGAKI